MLLDGESVSGAVVRGVHRIYKRPPDPVPSPDASRKIHAHSNSKFQLMLED